MLVPCGLDPSEVPHQTLLVDDATAPVAGALCARLALSGRRLLLIGSDPERLELLDVTLCQPELHRYTTKQELQARPSGLADWFKEQELGLDGLLLVPSPRHVANSVAVSDTLGAGADCLQGTKPCSVLVVLARPAWSLDFPEWEGAVTQAEFHAVVTHWTQQLPMLTTKLARRKVRINLLLAGPVLDARFAGRLERRAAESGLDAAQLLKQFEAQLRSQRAVTEAELATTVEPWFGPFSSQLSGNIVQVGTPDFR